MEGSGWFDTRRGRLSRAPVRAYADRVRAHLSVPLRGIAALAAAGLAACLDANPDFDGPATPSSGAGASSAADEGSTAVPSDLPISCAPDGLEPDDDRPMVTPGTLQLVLETAGAEDRFHVYLDQLAPKQFAVELDVPSLRACAYVRCETGTEAAAVTCTTGLSGVDMETGYPGCCGGPSVALDYVCGGDTTAKVYVDIDGSTHDCTYYGVRVTAG